MTETDECTVEMQNRVQNATHSEAEIHQMYVLLQDLESSMNNAKQRQEEYQELVVQNEKMQKELKSLLNEEGQLKRALDMKLGKECKQNIRRQKKREMKEQHVQEELRQCEQIHQKREEMADKIQQITGETQQLKAKIKSLRDVCSKETEKAQKFSGTTCVCIYDVHLSLHMDVRIPTAWKPPSRRGDQLVPSCEGSSLGPSSDLGRDLDFFRSSS
ncbi:hypothetical protein XENOCAPTIV_013341 [Xenoophorus captivus]|uniref:Uncharacterized protein n=1 Tax=Xenoophorus captivus TaxID=1517983 RepID=A0ABV0SF25_9TELE